VTDGLVLLGAWGEFGALIALFLFFVLRRTSDDPSAEIDRPTPEPDMEPPARD